MINKMTSYYKLLPAINNIVSINSMAAVNNSSSQLYGNNQCNNITISEATYHQYKSRYTYDRLLMRIYNTSVK